ncbi:Retrovirus-related Pol poly from transposon opus [Labeo rohita]|uniref:Retrovirus-related Pol poly from transposon opus n=1 Tax=Labeo rohita TaxID=84645 RepID=A0A498M968_LABRO|nr:Retrovirus-related Pol poly from transposon opus [Labeo rohita]
MVLYACVCVDDPFAIVRTDPAPGFSALPKDTVLTQCRLAIEAGNAKNINKNPVAKKAIHELQGTDQTRNEEITYTDPTFYKRKAQKSAANLTNFIVSKYRYKLVRYGEDLDLLRPE